MERIQMGLRIENEETERLARELARETGESLTVAVKEAIRKRLDRIGQNSQNITVERILEIGKECASHLKEPYKSKNPTNP
jgi:antitoxin VapB